jgi:hypothetical protein
MEWSAWNCFINLKLYDDEPLKPGEYTPAQVLEKILLKKWKFKKK